MTTKNAHAEKNSSLHPNRYQIILLCLRVNKLFPITYNLKGKNEEDSKGLSAGSSCVDLGVELELCFRLCYGGKVCLHMGSKKITKFAVRHYVWLAFCKSNCHLSFYNIKPRSLSLLFNVQVYCSLYSLIWALITLHCKPLWNTLHI